MNLLIHTWVAYLRRICKYVHLIYKYSDMLELVFNRSIRNIQKPINYRFIEYIIQLSHDQSSIHDIVIKLF